MTLPVPPRGAVDVASSDPRDAVPAPDDAVAPPVSGVPAGSLAALAIDAVPVPLLVADQAGRVLATNASLRAWAREQPLLGEPVTRWLPSLAWPPTPDTVVATPWTGTGAGRAACPVHVRIGAPAAADGCWCLAIADRSVELGLERALAGLFEASPYGLMVVDDSGRVAQANGRLAASLGHAPDALAGTPMSQLLPERYRGRHGALAAGYRADGRPRLMGEGRDLTARHADGREVPVEIGLSRVPWRGEMMTLAAVTDIRGRKRLEHALRQANANLEEFTYVASHDLRSPLRGVADLIEWIAEDLPAAPPDVQRNLERVRQRVARMEKLIDDLLSYARAGRAATEFSTVDAAALIASALEIQPLPPGFQLLTDYQATPFQATRTPLETVLRNLLANAVKHHDRRPATIRVSSREDDHWCEIRITDDGPGVPATAQERVFKLFQTATASERGGSGIGLALTKRLVEVHGGRIDLESPVAEGRGASFRVRWPRFPLRPADD